MRQRLLTSYEHATAELSKHGIPFQPVQGGIVLWLDLRKFLPSGSFEGEREMYDAIFKKCRVNISPGQAFHCSEPGWLRLCFTVPEIHLTEGLNRLAEHLKT
jgi:1-aminocyclopropane-1-carboxylate synthase